MTTASTSPAPVLVIATGARIEAGERILQRAVTLLRRTAAALAVQSCGGRRAPHPSRRTDV
jgi:hypothetical protein